MKKATLAFLFLAALHLPSLAQVNIGPMIGLNMANYAIKPTAANNATQLRPGVRAGGVIDIQLSDNASLQTGIAYVQNGFNSSNGAYFKVNTIEMPLTIEFHAHEFFWGGGFFLGLNKGGTAKLYNSRNGLLETYNIKVGKEGGNDLVPVDNGFIVNVGIQFKEGVFWRAHFLKGFVHLDPSSSPGVSVTDYNFGLSIGYFLFYKSELKQKKKAETPMHFNAGPKQSPAPAPKPNN